ncbi:MAG: hypothetical protein AAGE96_25380 [Cyanobacteria bacterium P01_G01_bin.19]
MAETESEIFFQKAVPRAQCPLGHPTPHTLQIPDTAKLIGIKSPKGTGKTYLLEQIVQQATREGKWGHGLNQGYKIKEHWLLESRKHNTGY